MGYKRPLTTTVGTSKHTTMRDQQSKRLKTSNEQQHARGPAKNYSCSQLAHINPVSFVQSCLKAYGCNYNIRYYESENDYFLPTSEERIASYEIDIIAAVRKNDIDFLRRARESGRSLQGCNTFGESIAHLACRRGSIELIKYLVSDGCVSLNVKDDYGRTPLHDACWKMDPNFDLIDLILDIEPNLLLIADKRGDSPLDYCRKEHWGQWVTFLSTRMKKEIKNRITAMSSTQK